MSLLTGNQLDATLGLCWPDTFESARAGSEGVPPEELPPLSREQTERAMEILKTLFNITFNTAKSEVDEVIMDVLFLSKLYLTGYSDSDSALLARFA